MNIFFLLQLVDHWQILTNKFYDLMSRYDRPNVGICIRMIYI